MSFHNSSKSNFLKIGLFGGSFDPIHLGHIHPIINAAKLLDLNSINIIPANISPLKDQTYSSNHHRAEMVKHACQEFPLFNYDNRELKRGNASYTIDTLQEIHNEYIEKKTPAVLHFFIGMDSLIDFTLWHRWQDILAICNIVVSPRPGYSQQDIPKELQPYLNDLTHLSSHNSQSKVVANRIGNIFLMPEMLSDISSTQIRCSISEHRSVKNKLSPKVHQYILKHKLY